MAEEESNTVVKTLKILSSIIVPTAAVLGALWAIDSHYASAADVLVMQRSIETQMRSLKVDRTEDELFKLDMKKQAQKGKLSPEDEALYQRYVRRLSDTSNEQRAADVAAAAEQKKK